MNLNRRNFLQLAGTVYLSAGLPSFATALARPGSQVQFPHGVASGDPLPDSILLWTRAVAKQGTEASLTLQLSEREDFEQVLIEEALTALAADDYTVRVQVDGLKPGHHYYYRFLATDGGISRTGRTNTAPESGAAQGFQMAFASCQNYEQGYYDAWGQMLEEDLLRPPSEQIQFVLHLGDFIYERYLNRAAKGQRFVRELPAYPDGASDADRTWADSLADYRHLYKVHLADPQLQAARARWPFINTWDDHEFSNDGFQHFSTYGEQPVPELQRRRNAHKAWFEYIPARVEQTEDLRIYRRLRWGKLADIVLTDLRTYRSAPPLPAGLTKALGLPLDPVKLVEIFDAGREYDNGQPPQTLPWGDGSTPNTAREREPGSMLGSEQKAWFKQTLAESDASWKIWGNSLPVIPLRLDLSTLPFQGMEDSVLSEDAWSGFPTEYNELMAFTRSANISGLVSLSGDHHMHGAGTLALDVNDPDSPRVAADFNVSGISSTPHFDSVIHKARSDNSDFMQLVGAEVDGQTVETWNMSLQQGVLASLAYDKSGMKSLAKWLGPNKANPGLAYVDTASNGYGLARFDAQACSVELVTIKPPLAASAQGTNKVLRRARFELPLWQAGEELNLTGPIFEGTPPFPW
jgi:alkaline phosphatase D